MRLKLLRLLAGVCYFLIFSSNLNAQNCIPTNINGVVINRDCSQICDALNFQIPHLKSSDDYTLVSVPYTPYPFNTSTGSEDPAIYSDDFFSNEIRLPFSFCFYGTTYSSTVVGSNGIMTFDLSNASCDNAWPITQPIPYAGGTICSSASTYYPRASIMGAYSDLDPRIGASNPGRKVQWEVIGTAPCRKFVVSYYQIGVFGGSSGSCPAPANTFQIVIHESTGVIEIFFLQKACASTTNGGRAILGIQNWDQNKAIAAPGKNNTVWNERNTGYRFIPSAGASRYVVSEIYTMGGTLVATADTATTATGLLDLSFPNVCVSNTSTNYVVRSTFSACDNPALLLVSYDTITVNLTSMQANTVTAATSCAGVNNGSVTVTPLTGTGPFTFSIDGGPAMAGSSPYIFTNLSAGNHTVITADAFGCVSSPIPVLVPAGIPLATSIDKTDALCSGSATGTITVDQPATGVGPFSYSLDGIIWQASPIFTGLSAGTFTVYYREGSGCQGSQPVTITEPDVLVATASSNAVICNGQDNGVILVTPGGGVGPYAFSVDGGTTWQASPVFNVVAGNYTVSIRDMNNCLITQNISVTEPAVLTASPSIADASCNGGNDGLIAVTPNGGNAGGYQYSIDGTTFQSSNTFNVAPGNFMVIVKDNQGCTTTFPATVGLINNLFFTPQTDLTICEGESTQLALSSNGSNYSWSPATGLSNTAIHNPVASPSRTTEYIVTTTLGRCNANDTIVVNVNAAPLPNAGPDGYICYGQSFQLQASGGTKYAWSPTSYLNDPTMATPTSTAPKDIVYRLSILSDRNGCASLTTDEMRIDVTAPLKVKTFPYDTIAYDGDRFQLQAISNDSDVINYSWSPVTGLSDPTIANPVVTAGVTGDDVLYQVITSTIAGCKGEGYVHLKVYKGPDIYVPTGFTPNNDGRNDQFMPFPVGIKSIQYFRVFNRWGQLIFQTKQLHKGWDGRVQGILQPIGTYVWMIEAVTNQDKLISKKGTVTLIR